jgi:hypothetical protein
MYPWASYKTLVPFLIGVLILAIFGFYESRPVQPTFAATPFRSAIEVLPTCMFVVVFSMFGAGSVEVVWKYKLITIAVWPCLAVGVGIFAFWRPGDSAAMKYGPQFLTGAGRYHIQHSDIPDECQPAYR